MPPNRIAVVAFFSSLLLAPSARAVGAQVPSDPCAQATAAQVSTALGETVDAGTQGPTVTCTWVANRPTHQIVTLVYSPPGDWSSRKTRQLPGITKVAVSGVGDDAIAETLGNAVTLFVKKGSVIFIVRVYGVPDPAKQLAIEKPIALAVAAKL
ncbi:MAG: hypothetical protein M3Y05_12400 [Gemmatimonadota bacterium]|nr:hypothetical protein [Gemmatimonadota bacterium]